MLLALFFLLYSDTIDPPTTYDGRAGKLAVRVPRLEVEPAIDGKLDEQVWGEAALLTGFSQFSPADGVPAADSTEVLVWYSPPRSCSASGPLKLTARYTPPWPRPGPPAATGSTTPW